ncbi:MAG TPA: adenylate/guanylate cyclase domain-containing protein [Solirubrobacteraceae bacterium]|nr:adenylate/guanylate cyclase domain-containing protein [Solirubrobacteraceae bacterium]
MQTPATHYLDHDGVKIAWQAFGDGPAELLFIPGWVSNVDLFWQYPQSAAFFSELGSFARVAIYDKPGTGASDPVEAAPTVELRIEQLIGVMDAAGLERPTVVGVSEGGVTACLAAAGRPERVGRVVLLDASAAGLDPRTRGDMTEAEFGGWADLIRRTAEHWGEGHDGDIWLSGIPDADVSWGRLQRACATPAVARRYYQAISKGLSAWDVLPSIRQPVLVLHRTGDRVLPIKAARAAAERIPDVRIVELPGSEHLPWLGDTSEILAQIRAFVGAPPPPPRAERVLATILFTDIVGSTDQLARLGDAAWRGRLQRHEEIVRAGLARYDGRLVKSTGDGVLATFAGPARGTGAARWILDALPSEELHARAGVHVGEIELQGDDIAGLAVHVAARIMARADADEVLVSRTVRDLTAGSGLLFEDRGVQTLKGIPDDWHLYALA